MRNLFAVPWLTLGRRTLLSMGLAVLVVVGIFALLKIGSGGKHAPEKELLTGSIQKAPVRTSPSNDPMASFLAPVLSEPAPRPVQSTAMDRAPVPLPRPRPNRL